jgi:hypothetical protein
LTIKKTYLNYLKIEGKRNFVKKKDVIRKYNKKINSTMKVG